MSYKEVGVLKEGCGPPGAAAPLRVPRHDCERHRKGSSTEMINISDRSSQRQASMHVKTVQVHGLASEWLRSSRKEKVSQSSSVNGQSNKGSVLDIMTPCHLLHDVNHRLLR